MADVLDVVRTALRRKTKALDDTELAPMIEAAKIDLSRAGVSIVSEQDPLTQMAIRLYCQWMVERDPVIKSFYDDLKNGMALDGRYRSGDDVESLGC